MNSIDINGKAFAVKGELPNGFFYLEGPRGGDVHFAKPAEGVFFFYPAKGGLAVRDNGGLILSATREELAA